VIQFYLVSVKMLTSDSSESLRNSGQPDGS
jgi:hypothetical protein